jgi:nicotinamidase-related amidase
VKGKIMAKKMHLVCIDPQWDFADPKGALYVKGADKDMERLASMVKKLKRKLDDIHVTLDSHHLVHVAHPIFWKDSAGNNPSPFTIITAKDVRDGTWTTTKPSLFKRAKDYVEALEKNARYPLCIWPPHCLIGSVGQAVYPPFYEALMEWCNDFAAVDYVTKGSNIMTEHYSAIVADVPDPNDPGTQMNVKFLNTINEADIVLLAGEAGSHCLRNSLYDMLNYFKDDSMFEKIVLLTDATSPVPGFEHLQEEMIKEMVTNRIAAKKTPIKLTTTKDFLA